MSMRKKNCIKPQLRISSFKMLEWCLLIEHKVELKSSLRKFIKMQSLAGQDCEIGKIPNFKEQELNWPQQRQIGGKWSKSFLREAKDSIGMSNQRSHACKLHGGHIFVEQKKEKEKKNFGEPQFSTQKSKLGLGVVIGKLILKRIILIVQILEMCFRIFHNL